MPLAEQDLEAAFDCAQQGNEKAAKELVERILSAVGILARYGLTGREGRVKGTRELVITRTPCVIAYPIHQDEIQILAVLHGARRWPTTFGIGYCGPRT